jgi:TonB family protein
MLLSILLNGLWQGAFLVAAALLLRALTSKQDAATRHALWFVTLIALVVVPVMATFRPPTETLIRLLGQHHAPASFSISLLPYHAFLNGAAGLPAGWQPAMLAVWLAGVAIVLARLAFSCVRIERLRRRARPLPGGDPDCFMADGVAVPIVAGIVHPVVIIPRALASELGEADLRRIVAHERAHIMRHDPLVNLIARLIEAALFFNPWVRLALARLCEEREGACDDVAIERTGSADDYAKCLADLAEGARSHRLPLLTPSAYGSRHPLIARIERLRSHRSRRLGVNRYAFGAIAGSFIVITLVLQLLVPARAYGTTFDRMASETASSRVAIACAHPNAEAEIINAVAPELPHGISARGVVNVLVTIAPSGRVEEASTVHSSGNQKIDAAVLVAARQSTYSAKIVNCTRVEGRYLFHVLFSPQP